MPFCMNCGQQLPEGAKFCSDCGAAMGAVKVGTEQRKTVYDGELHKCPNCGELLNSFVTNCPTCGYELRSVKVNSPVNELARKIELASSANEKIELITNFYVPNTKEDIYDFFILAVSNLEDTNYDTDDAWRAKLEQTYHKAKILFGKSPEFEYIDELYKKTIDKVSKRGPLIFIRKNKKLCLSTLLVCVGIIMLVVGIIIMSSVSIEENWGASYGGVVLLILGLNFLFGPVWVYFIAKENVKKEDNGTSGSEIGDLLETSKETVDALRKNFKEIADQFKSMRKK